MTARDLDVLERTIVLAARSAGWLGMDLRAQVMPRDSRHWVARVAVGWSDGLREEIAIAETPEGAVEGLLSQLAREVTL